MTTDQQQNTIQFYTIFYKEIFRLFQVNSFVGAFHDAVILYALAANETIEAGHSPNNGSEITRRMWNRTFKGLDILLSQSESLHENGGVYMLSNHVARFVTRNQFIYRTVYQLKKQFIFIFRLFPEKL